ncbi:hypothetical protein AB0P15_10820 [Streptomyces sp. NPDC087917]|uniref:hypothetical protein n=1 Tax=Streptomyces sp. NPDC087917 TaxID=3155060 RepID=UPI0034250907
MAGAPGRVVGIEAVWDGDTTHDWFVILLAVTEDPPGERELATVHRGAAVRLLGEGPYALPHPSAAAADRVGRALADRFGVPFHFGSPEVASYGAPRLRP